MANERTFREDVKGFGYHLMNPTLLLMFGLGIILQITYTGVWTYLPFHLTSQKFGLTLDEISLIYFVYGFGVIGAPIAGWLSNRFTLEKVRTVAILVLIFGVALTITSSLTIVLIGMCITLFWFLYGTCSYSSICESYCPAFKRKCIQFIFSFLLYWCSFGKYINRSSVGNVELGWNYYFNNHTSTYLFTVLPIYDEKIIDEIKKRCLLSYNNKHLFIYSCVLFSRFCCLSRNNTFFKIFCF